MFQVSDKWNSKKSKETQELFVGVKSYGKKVKYICKKKINLN